MGLTPEPMRGVMSYLIGSLMSYLIGSHLRPHGSGSATRHVPQFDDAGQAVPHRMP